LITLPKGDDNEKIIPLVSKAMDMALLQYKVQELEQKLNDKFGFDRLIGRSAAITDVIKLAQKVAMTDTTVLLLGETGTGKELFAEAIHQASPRRAKSFVAVNCSAFTKELLESELFGHKEGSFTGAIKDKKGLFEEASGGTIFLDEMGELDHDLQAKLLRVLESQQFIKIGDTKTTQVSVRILAATNRDLQEDKRIVFRAYDTVSSCLTMAAAIVNSASYNKEAIEPTLDRGFLDATSLAEYFVTKGIPFRTAHHIVGSLVLRCEQAGKTSAQGVVS